MAINPPSDIVLDVARNADAEMAASATRRLGELGSTTNVTSRGQSFSTTLEGVAGMHPSRTKGSSALYQARMASAGHSATNSRSSKVSQQFEAVLLNSFVNELMPKGLSSVYGQGTAGDIWKSMLSDQIAQQIAKSGTIGISRRLFSAHAIIGSSGGAGNVNDARIGPNAAQSSSLPLSTPLDAKLVGESGMFLNRRRS